MDNELFRKTALDKMKSPDNLNDYVHVTNPGVWLLLAAVIVLLIGAVIWGVFGQIESTREIAVSAENGVITGTVSDVKVEKGMIFRIGETEYTVASAEQDSVTGRFRCTVSAPSDLPDGLYSAVLVLEHLRPVSFVLN